MKVIIVNYNSGNLASLYNSFFRVATDRKIKINLLISNNPKEIENADRVVLPGVGDFSNCKNQLFKIKGMKQAVYLFGKVTADLESFKLSSERCPRWVQGVTFKSFWR